jgi:hypothetical protein
MARLKAGSVLLMLSMVFETPMEMMHSCRSVRVLTSIFRPLSSAGPPASTVHVSSRIGSWMTPARISLWRRTAMVVAKCGMP